jgi:hypothetical protein
MLLARTRLVFLAVLVVALSGAALANPVNMNFLGPGGNNGGGVYTYPYNFSINGGSSTPLICDAYDNEIISGETWQANVNPLLSGAGLFGASTTAYEEAAIIFNAIVTNKVDASAGNFAIWGLFSSNPQSNPFFTTSNAAGIEAWALAQIALLPPGFFNNFALYTPISGTQSWGGTPQEFIGYNVPAPVPEPGTMALLGTGLFAIGGLLRKKKRA